MHLKQLAATTAVVTLASMPSGLAQGPRPVRSASSEVAALTHFNALSILIKYNTALVEKADLTAAARNQVGLEQTLWRRLDPMIVRCGTGAWCMKANPNQTAFLEWQTLAAERSDRAATALNTLVEPGHTGNVGVFVFARTAVEGREASFAAQEVLPTMRQLFLQAGARAPGKVMVAVPLPSSKYDFNRKALMLTPAVSTSYASYEKREPGELLTLRNRSIFDDQPIPAPAGERAAYLLGQLPGEPENESPGHSWRNFSRGSGAVLPQVSMLATDRHLRVEAIAMDAAKAEKIAKDRSTLAARIYLTIDGTQLLEPASRGGRVREDARVVGILLARVDRIDIVAGEEVLGAVPAAQLPAAVANPPKAGTPPAAGVAPQSRAGVAQPAPQVAPAVAPGGEQGIKDRIKAAEAEIVSLRQMLALVCRQTAAKVNPDEKSTAHRRTYSDCMR